MRSLCTRTQCHPALARAAHDDGAREYGPAAWLLAGLFAPDCLDLAVAGECPGEAVGEQESHEGEKKPTGHENLLWMWMVGSSYRERVNGPFANWGFGAMNPNGGVICLRRGLMHVIDLAVALGLFSAAIPTMAGHA